MKMVKSSKTQKSFGSGRSVDAVKPHKKMAAKPRAIKTPGGRAGLKKGAGG